MRRVLLGLVASVLALGGARAGECVAGSMDLVSGGKTFAVEEASHSKGHIAGRAAERTILLGRLGDQPLVVDIQALQGMSATASSYVGEVDKGFPAPQWGTHLTFNDGDVTQIYDGPLRGQWTAVCQ